MGKAVREKLKAAGWLFHHHGKGDHDAGTIQRLIRRSPFPGRSSLATPRTVSWRMQDLPRLG